VRKGYRKRGVTFAIIAAAISRRRLLRVLHKRTARLLSLSALTL